MSSYCSTCGTSTGGDVHCTSCGSVKKSGGPGGFLPLIGWLLIPFTIAVYPVMGLLSSAAMALAALIMNQLGSSDGVKLLVMAVTGYLSLLLTLHAERTVSRHRNYRIFRWIVRIAVGVVVAIVVVERAGRGISPANALFIAVIGIPALLFIASLFDRVLRVVPEKPVETTGTVEAANDAQLNVWKSLKWAPGIIVGFVLAIIGMLVGREAGLFLGAFLWVVTVALFVIPQVVWRILGNAGRAKKLAADAKADGPSPGVNLFGGWTGAIVGGALVGAVFGALTTLLIDHYVNVGSVIGPALLGIVIGVIIQVFRRRKAAPAR